MRRASVLLVAAPRSLLAGLTMLAVLALVALFAKQITWYDPLAINPPAQFSPPSWNHLFGTDGLGMDVFARVVFATRYDLPMALLGVTIATAVGIVLGLVAGLSVRVVDEVIDRAADGLQAFPPLLLAMLIAGAIGAGFGNVVTIIALVSGPVLMRVTRTQTLRLRKMNFVLVAEGLGYARWRVAMYHIVPNSIGPIVAQAAVGVGSAVVLAAALGFVGLGPPVPQPEWGAMIASGAEQLMAGRWWMSIFPGLAVVFTVAAFLLVSDGIQEYVGRLR